MLLYRSHPAKSKKKLFTQSSWIQSFLKVGCQNLDNRWMMERIRVCHRTRWLCNENFAPTYEAISVLYKDWLEKKHNSGYVCGVGDDFRQTLKRWCCDYHLGVQLPSWWPLVVLAGGDGIRNLVKKRCEFDISNLVRRQTSDCETGRAEKSWTNSLRPSGWLQPRERVKFKKRNWVQEIRNGAQTFCC